MKKRFSFFLVITAILLLGSITNVNAESSSYWQSYFENHNAVSISGVRECYEKGGYGLVEWKDINQEFLIYNGGCGDVWNDFKFEPRWNTTNLVFVDVTNIAAKSSDKNILYAEFKPYDLSSRKESLESYITYYNDNITLEDLNNAAKNMSEPKTYDEKPTWWEWNGFDSEPEWWQVYGMKKEPSNAVEVITYARNIGKDYITLSADGKEDIKITWTIQPYDFVEMNSYDQIDKEKAESFRQNKSQGLIEILNNLDKYQEIIPKKHYSYEYEFTKNGQEYNYYYEIDNNEDLSDIINALKGKDITIRFTKRLRDFYWIETEYYLNGKDITSTVEKGFTYDHNISVEKSVYKDEIDELVESEITFYLDFTYHGSLPAPYTMQIDLLSDLKGKFINQALCYSTSTENQEECIKEAEKKAKDLINSSKFSLLYYNPETGEMEVITDKLKVNENGVAELNFDHFSSYVVVRNDYVEEDTPTPPEQIPSDSTPDNSAPNNAQTSSLDVVFYNGIAISSLIGMSYIILRKKNKKIA